MVKKEKNSGRMVWRSAFKKLLFFAVALMLVGGCTKLMNNAELADHRERQARNDIDILKPPMDINFEQPLSLSDLIQIGLRNNLEVRVSRLNQEISNKETLAQKLRMLPGLTADARFEYRNKLRKSDVYNWKEDRDQPDFTVSELKDTLKGNLSLTWNVLDTAVAYVRSNALAMQEQVLEQKRVRQAQQLALEITEAYWQAAALEDALDYVHAVEKRLKAVKRKIDDAVAARAMDSMDAAEAELRLKELELTIRQLQANLSSSRLELSRLLGFNQNVQYTLARPPIKPIVAALPHTKELDIDSLEEYALLHRPELYQSDIQVMIQKEEAKRAFLNLFPGVNFFAATHYDDNRLLYANTWNSVGAGVGWNLLEIPANLAQLRGREKSIDMAEAQRLMMTVGVITQVHIALLDYAIKVDRFRLLEETYQLAANLLNMAREKNSVGRLPELAVTQRHLEEMAAKLRRDEAVVDMLVAHKRLCVSIGMAPQDCDGAVMVGGSVPQFDPTLVSEFTSSSADYDYSGPGGFNSTDLGGDSIGTGGAGTGGIGGAGTGFDNAADMGSGAGAGTGGDPWSSSSDFGTDMAPPEWERSSGPGAAIGGSRSAGVGDEGWASGASDRFLWKVQMGAFTQPGGPSKRMDQIQNLDIRLLDNRDARITTKRLGSSLFNRVRVMGLTEPQAKALAQDLKQKGMEYWVIPPESKHW